MADILPSAQPKTHEEVRSLLNKLEGLPTERVPVRVRVIRYKESGLYGASGLEFLSIFPWMPWEGPPVPKLLPGWPWTWKLEEVPGGIRKQIKSMILRMLPDAILKVDLYALRATMEGQYMARLTNEGEVALATGDVVKSLDMLKERLINSLRKPTPWVDTGREGTITFEFRASGWDLVKKLWDYMWNRSVEVQTIAEVAIPGYETADYIVQDYRRHIEVDAVLPVHELTWHAW